jgi:hypothetical protein
VNYLVCYERGWEAHKRNEEATAQIRRLFARYRAEARRARTISDDEHRMPVARTPVERRERDEDRELIIH